MNRRGPVSGRQLAGAAGRGALAGVAGVAAMTAAEKLEQLLTGRPDSYVPARTLLTLLGRRPSERETPFAVNQAMHWGTGVVLGALRGVWALVGLRGPRADLAFTVVRLSTDQTLENATGAGAPPHTWPLQEQLLDTAEKAVYACATGRVVEHLVAPDESRAGTVSH